MYGKGGRVVVYPARNVRNRTRFMRHQRPAQSSDLISDEDDDGTRGAELKFEIYLLSWGANGRRALSHVVAGRTHSLTRSLAACLPVAEYATQLGRALFSLYIPKQELLHHFNFFWRRRLDCESARTDGVRPKSEVRHPSARRAARAGPRPPPSIPSLPLARRPFRLPTTTITLRLESAPS